MALVKLEITTRKAFAEGQSFSAAGRYEQIDGLAHFAVDPAHPHNAVIADIALAPRNAGGLVEFTSDFRIIKPVDNDHGNGRLLLDVLNRGKELALKNLNSAPDAPPDADPHPGNGFLMRQGYSLVWCGWQHDVPEAAGLFRCNVPNAKNDDGSPVSGKIVVSFQPLARTDTQFLSDRDHRPYPTNHLESWDSVLTVQEHEDAAETVIPREEWAFARLVDGRRVPDATHLTLKGGFEAGKVYRAVYETSHAPVIGLGLLATRDIVAWLRHGKTDLDGVANPLAGALGRAYAYGRSQSGRFLRQMLHLGLNRDEESRVVFEGMLPNVAGGKMGEFTPAVRPAVQPFQPERKQSAALPGPGAGRRGRSAGRGDAARSGAQDHLHQHVVGILGRPRRAGSRHIRRNRRRGDARQRAFLAVLRHAARAGESADFRHQP